MKKIVIIPAFNESASIVNTVNPDYVLQDALPLYSDIWHHAAHLHQIVLLYHIHFHMHTSTLSEQLLQSQGLREGFYLVLSAIML